jgi:hypothetical protein
MIRPAAFLERVGWKAGMDVWFDMPEMGIEGWAKVIALSNCPEIRAGPGRLVLSTFKRRCDNLLELHCEGMDKPLELTAGHRLFSEDRKQWIPAGLLRVGERIKTRTGSVAIAEIKQKPGVWWVYNLEVEGEHEYFVGKLKLLCHNANCFPIKTQLDPQRKRYVFKDATTGKRISYEEAVERFKSIRKEDIVLNERQLISDTRGYLREEKVARITQGHIVREKLINPLTKEEMTDIDVIAKKGKGHLISIGGHSKISSENKLERFERELKILEVEAKKRGHPGVQAYLETNKIPTDTKQRIENIIGKKNLRRFKL